MTYSIYYLFIIYRMKFITTPLGKALRKKNVLLIIDPQNDFSEAKDGSRSAGALAVTGSNGDYERIIKLIKTNIFKEIHVSLDTHTENHIGHAGFYDSLNVSSDVRFIRNNAKNKNHQDYLTKYRQKHSSVRPGPEHGVATWPNHCIENSVGHKVVDELLDALNKATCEVKYHIKGQNELSEMYSMVVNAVVRASPKNDPAV
jgi:nicotinamidase-related amidase